MRRHHHIAHRQQRTIRWGWLGIEDIQQVIGELEPLEGARDFVDSLRERFQTIILSDTFYPFAGPLMRKLGYPTLFCHDLEIGAEGRIEDYHLRMPDQKREAVRRFKELRFPVIAAGDSYNDTTMLAEADTGFLFRAPDNVRAEFPQFKSAMEYDDLMALIRGELES